VKRRSGNRDPVAGDRRVAFSKLHFKLSRCGKHASRRAMLRRHARLNKWRPRQNESYRL
jgi:hypothetical protein